jgi:hypothetical protein
MVVLALGGVAFGPWRHAAIDDRVTIWSDAARGLTPIGRGIGQFYTSFPLFESRMDPSTTRIEHAHNDWLELGFELGIPGVAFALWLVWSALRGKGAEEDKLAFAAFCISACFAFPFHNPATAFMAVVLAGGLLASGTVVRNSWNVGANLADARG